MADIEALQSAQAADTNPATAAPIPEAANKFQHAISAWRSKATRVPCPQRRGSLT